MMQVQRALEGPLFNLSTAANILSIPPFYVFVFKILFYSISSP